MEVRTWRIASRSYEKRVESVARRAMRSHPSYRTLSAKVMTLNLAADQRAQTRATVVEAKAHGHKTRRPYKDMFRNTKGRSNWVF